MANYKISELGDTIAITDDDFFPVVDSDSSTTQRVDAQVIKEYMTGSVVNSLSASVLSGSDTYTTTLTSSYTTGSDAKLTTLSASFVTGSDAKFTSISGTLQGTATNVKVTSTVQNSTYYIPFVDGWTTEDRVLYSDSGITYNPATNALSVSYLSGRLINSLVFNSNGGVSPGNSFDNLGTFVVSYNTIGAAATGSNNTFTETNTFSNKYVTASVGITGSDAKFTSITASSITANEYNVVTINRTTLSQEGNTKFGDDELDTHQFSGSMYVSGNVSGAIANFTTLNGNLDWSSVQSVPTEIANAAGTASNNTFVGVNTFNTHYITASQGVTGSDGKFTTLSASYVTGSDAKFTSVSASFNGNGSQITNLTASNIDNFTADVRTQFTAGTNITINNGEISSSNQTITLSGDATGSGTTSITIGDVTASFIKAGTDGSNLTNLTSSQLSNFTNDVRSQFIAGTNITINNGEISASLASAGDVFLGSDNAFTAVNTFSTHYVTASVGITGSDGKFVTLSGNLDWSYIVNEPTFLESGDTITLSGDATGSGTGATSIAIGDVTASFIKAGTDGSNLTSLTSSQLSNFTNDVRSQFTAGTNITINNGEISASSDVTLAGNNTFTGINTFNNHYLTASVGLKVGLIDVSGNGEGNVAIGRYVLTNNVSGARNIAIGLNTLENNTTHANIAIGAEALRYNTTGRGNVALGDSALRASVDSWTNTAIGSSALRNLSGSNTETTENTAVGASSLKASVTGSKNTAVGYDSLVSNVYGSNNVAIGHSAGSDVITGSNNVFIGYQAATGETSLENTVIIRTDQEVMRINDSGQLSASSFIGDGSTLTNLTASQISNFTEDVRGQFTAGTNITILNGQISATSGGGSGDVLSDSDNTFTAVNTFSNQYITASVGVTGSDAKFASISSSNFYSEDSMLLQSNVSSSGYTDIGFILRTVNNLGYLDKILTLQNSASEDQFYVTEAGSVSARGSYTFTNPVLYYGNDGVLGHSVPLKIRGNGSSGAPAVRIGNKDNNTNQKAAAVSINIDSAPIDLVEFHGNGDVDISGSLIANVRVSGSVASPINATSYTLSSADRGKTLLFSNSATQNITCSSGLDVGYNCTFVQMGSGQLILSGASGVELLNRQSHTGSAGQYAVMSLIVIGNNKYLVAGDTV